MEQISTVASLAGDGQAAPASLDILGWRPSFAAGFAPFDERGYVPARVAVAYGAGYRLYTARGEVDAELAGRLRYEAADRGALPVVGDWVATSLRPGEARATIHAVLPRLSTFSRKVAGSAAEEQVVAANVDTVLLMTGLDRDFNLRRIERYLVVAWESGAAPIVVLSKADLYPDVEQRVAEVGAIAPGVPIHAISALRDEGLAGLGAYVAPGRTVAVLGSSGVGKSTLINRLAGRDLLRTAEVRAADGRGRHTTTHRELVLLPGGGLIMDTPGLRELQLWEAGAGHRSAFGDVESLAEGCRFHDCTHRGEPGCAVQQAVEDGRLSAARFESYTKLEKELRYLEMRLDKRAQSDQQRQHKAIHREMRHFRPRE